MSWLFPAYFLALAGVALPWILHRFSDQNPPEQLFPSGRFLEPTTPPVSRKRLLRYRALLALRLLSLLLLCILFAQPLWNERGQSDSERQHHIVAIDQTLSMRADGRWQAAVSEAQTLLGRLGDSSVQLVGFDQRVSVLASTLPDDPQSTLSPAAALDALEPGFLPADYGVLMQRLDRIASQRELPVKLWLISDLQQSSLPSQLNALFAPSISELALVPVITDNPVNVHLQAEATSSDGATASVSVSLLASSAKPDEQPTMLERTVRIESAERTLAQRVVSLRPGELTTLNFDELVLPARSDTRLRASLLEPDALSEDNAQQLPIVEPQPTGIVLLNSPGSIAGNAPVFVTTALETNGLSRVEPIRGTALQVPPDTPHLVTGRALDVAIDLDLLQFVDTGSNALVYNTAAVAGQNNVQFDGSMVGTVDETHPLALGDIDWFGTRFYGLPEFLPEEEDRVLLETSEGVSILVERTTNRGRLLILNDPLDGLASNLPLQPAFVALMQSLIRYFDASTSVPDTVVIGERLALPPNVQLVDPGGESVLNIVDSARSSTVELAEPGLYTVVSNRGEQTLRAILDTRESNLTVLAPADIDAWQARYVTDANATSQSDRPIDSATANVSKTLRNESDLTRYSLWPWLFAIIALVFLTEGWFANRHLHVRRDGS